ncbi:glycosyltransferase family 4 protein [Desulfolucanica intricata]|uniref:glycosyltransferase family 4 protein n=1 Tax=Desulfolucanica intricata TaxID=1285191 RepID=UPI00082CFDB0|nr:glycosyltransferase family 4 protein [Desulfolucanica intricata]
MSVLIFLSTSGRGGRELNTLRIMPYLRNRGMTVSVVVLDSGGYVTKRCNCGGLDCQALGLWPSKLNLLAVWLRFFFLLRKTRPELVQVYGFLASLICRFTAPPLGIKVIVGIVGAGHFTGKRPLWERLTRQLVNHYVANSLDGKHKMLKLLNPHQPEISVIYNGVPELAIPSEKPKKNYITVGTVANLRPEKGYDVMLEALVKVKEKLGEKVALNYLIAGEGGLREELTEKINTMGLTGQVNLLGMVDNVTEMLLKLDLFVLPSYTEGLPNALLEAMAAGRCVIATRVGGVPEIIEDGYNGLIVEPGNPDELAGVMVKVLLEPQWRESLAARGREVVSKKFSLERQAEETIRVWTAVCNQNCKVGRG